MFKWLSPGAWPGGAVRIVQATLGVAIGCLAIAGIYVSMMLSERQASMAEVSRYNVAFSASQGVNEYMRLRQRLATAALNPLSPKARQEVVLRFEILQNRMNLFKSGDFGAFIRENPERVAVIDKVTAMIAAIEPAVRSMASTGDVISALKLTKPLEEDFIGLASEANSYGGAAVADDQRQMFRLHWIFTMISLSLAFCGFVLFMLNRLQNRQLVVAQCSLATANADLADQNRLFEAAMDNMSQGLCMFDADHRLIVSNRRMAEIYSLPHHGVRSGVGLKQLSSGMVESGSCSPEQAEWLHRGLESIAGRGKPDTMLAELADGRIVLVSSQPTPGGGWTATHEDITERHRAQAQVEHMARHDTLTGLPNRLLLRERLEETLIRDAEAGLSTAVLCLDLDNFKTINDTFGHPFGDLLIREVAGRVQSVFRPFDTVSRVGGDEFTVVYGGLKDVESVEEIAKRLLAKLAEPYFIGSHQVLSGGSVGLSLSRPEDCETDLLLKNADMALYDAKAAGRGTYSFYREDMARQMERRRWIESRLLAGDFTEQFEMAYQPITDLASGRVTSVEALLRIRREQEVPVAPQEVISIAEDTGRIVELGAWVMRNACEAAARMDADVAVAVNLSPVQFRRDDIVKMVSEAVEAAGISPGRLNLEITETVLLEDSREILASLAKLKDMGAKVSLDDFGTGYSSLSYLRRFSVDKLKIDRQFVQEIGRNSDHKAIVQTIVNMADALGMRTVAEGVETAEQLRILRDVGCDEVQGYLFSKPLAEGNLRRYLASKKVAAA